VAVFDTGCDLAAAGLATTSNGRPKYLDFLDCTGGGDVDTSRTVRRESDGSVKGLSGRALQLGPWADGVDEFRVGARRLFDFMPTGLVRRLREERRRLADVRQHAAVREVQRAIDDLDRAAGELAQQDKLEQKRRKDDLLLQQAQLKELMEKREDPGPLMDALLFRDGQGTWRAVLDVDCDGDLADALPMAPFALERQTGVLGQGMGAELTFCVQVYEEGSRLCVVADAGSHGTHVAGIAAAHFPGRPDEDGVAPGAQVLACKIGDGRLASAETGAGLIRALLAAKSYGCDLINLSYGEPFWEADRGRVAECFNQASRDWGIAVFTSAGNSGPALCTLGAPGGSLSEVISVAAYCSPAMMEANYSMIDAGSAPASCYGFSSRGPTPDGWMPSICAPGGAIAPVPRHLLQGKMQMHGTSMSSPNACGVAACILSALRADGVSPLTPAELLRALQNSAQVVEGVEPWAQGCGLVQALPAIEYAAKHAGKAGQGLRFKVEVPARGGARGIFVRDPAELERPLSFAVQVSPVFGQAIPDEAGRQAQLDLELDLALESTAPWVTASSTLILQSGLSEYQPRSFTVRLDVSKLPPGVHFAEVRGVERSDPERGPLLRLPVTVVAPHASGQCSFPLRLQPGCAERRFVAVPEAAEWAEITLRTGALPEGPHSVVLHALAHQRTDEPHTVRELKRFLLLKERHEDRHILALSGTGGAALELDLATLWLSNPAACELEVDVKFHSLGLGMGSGGSRSLTIGAAQEWARVEASAPLRGETLHPSAILDAVERAIRPVETTVSALADEGRDLWPPLAGEPSGRQFHQAVLKYELEVAPGEGSATQKVRPRVEALHHQLYDSPVDSALWRLQDASGAILAYGGLIHDAPAVELPKGKYTLLLLLRHVERGQLEQLKDLPVLLTLPMPKSMDAAVYSTAGAATMRSDGAVVKERWLPHSARQPLYVARPKDKPPPWCAPGDVLSGSLRLSPSQPCTRLVCELPPLPAQKKDPEPPEPEDQRPEAERDAEKLSDAVRDAKLACLTELRTSGASADRYGHLADQLLAEHPDHLPLLLERLEFAARASGGSEESLASVQERADSVSSAADALVATLNLDAIAQHFGTRHDSDKPEVKKEVEKMETRRTALRTALLRKAAALAELTVQEGAPEESRAALLAASEDLHRWVPGPDAVKEDERDRLALATCRYEAARGRPGAGLEALRKRMALRASGSAEAKQLRLEACKLYRQLGWQHWEANQEELMHRDFPPALPPL